MSSRRYGLRQNEVKGPLTGDHDGAELGLSQGLDHPGRLRLHQVPHEEEAQETHVSFDRLSVETQHTH